MNIVANVLPLEDAVAAANTAMREAYAKLDESYWLGKNAHTFRFDNFRQMVDRKNGACEPVDQRVVAETVAQEIRRNGKVAVYAGLPWCIQTCAFCDLAYGRNPSVHEQQDYASTLHRELAIHAELGLADVPVNSCYFGGGTPTILETNALSRYIDGIIQRLKISDRSVVTCEASAATLSPRKLDALRERVNRISLGVQTTDTAQRQSEGRILPREKLLQKLSMTLERFEAVNVDLMYGLRGDSRQTVYRSVCDMIELGVPSITFYRTELFPGTKTYELARSAPWESLSERAAREYYFLGRALLTAAGYSEQPLGWFIKGRNATPSTWQAMIQGWAQVVPYVGIGLGAFSTSSRYWLQNSESLLAWKRRVDMDQLSVARFVSLEPQEQCMVRFMRHIRVHRVMDMSLLASELPEDEPALRLFVDGLVTNGLVTMEGARLTLTTAGESLIHVIIDDFARLVQGTGSRGVPVTAAAYAGAS